MEPGIRLNLIEKGLPDSPAVLFLHGFMGSALDWDKVTTALSDEFHCVAIDLPGHGATAVPDDDELYSMPGAAAAILEKLDEIDVSRCHLVGYSMGGRLALYMAVNCPERFDRIILESASPGLKTSAECLERRKRDLALAARLREIPFDHFLIEWYEQPLFESIRQDEKRFLSLLKRRFVNNPEGLARSLENMGTGSQPSLWEQLPSISAPMLLIAGEMDDKFIGINAQMAAACQAARPVVVDGAGHNVHLERPDELVAIVRSFLQ